MDFNLSKTEELFLQMIREFAEKYLDVKNASLCIVGKLMKKEAKIIDALF